MKRVILFFTVIVSKFLSYYHKAMEKAKPFLQHELPAAIQVMETFKTIIENPAADVATFLIPGKLDDIILNYAREYLPIALVKAHVIEESFAAAATNDEIISKAALLLHEWKAIDKSRYGKLILDTVAEISHALTDGKLSLSELASLAHGIYESQVKKAA